MVFVKVLVDDVIPEIVIIDNLTGALSKNHVQLETSLDNGIGGSECAEL